MSKTYKHHPDERAMGKVARAAKKTVQLSAAARRLRKNFTAYIQRRAWNEDLLS